MKNLKEECVALYRENYGVWSAECKQAARMHKTSVMIEIANHNEQELAAWCGEVGFEYFTVSRDLSLQTKVVRISGWV